MNIQCQQCGTSYAVADDKVRGRLMKVRCKSCSEVIRVDGTVLGAADGSSAPPELSRTESKAPVSKPPSILSRPGVEGASWHIAVGDGTQGPYTLDELREYYAQGSVMLDTLVFRDGMAEWTPAGEVPELAAPSQAQSHTQTGALAFAGGVSMGSDPFGERIKAQPSKSPRVSASEMLDENVSREHTVQFSLDQIRALSSASQPVPLQASPSIAPSRLSTSPSTGYASGDGSGLIDVRKLAEMHAQMTAQEAPRAEVESSSLIPSHSSYAHTLAPLSLPLPPSAAQSGGIDSKTKLIAGLAAFGMVLAAAVGVLALTRQPQGPVVAASQPIAPDHVVNSQPADEPKVAAAEEEQKPEVAKAETEEPKADKEEPAAEADDEGDSETASRGSKRSGKRNKGKSKGDSEDSEDSEPVAKADKKDEKKEKGSAKESIDDLLAGGPTKPNKNSSASASIDDLLDNAVSGKKSAPKAEEKPADSGLPQTPSRDAMLGALGKAKAKAAKCKGPGVATAAIQIAGSGKVSSVTVTGAEGAAASCVEKAVRSTPFPKFQKDSFEVKFPFKLGG